MYTAYLLLFLGAFLLSANWAIGTGGVGVILTLMTVRLADEERRLAGALRRSLALVPGVHRRVPAPAARRRPARPMRAAAAGSGRG